MSNTNNNGITCSLPSGVNLEAIGHLNLVIHLDQLQENVVLTHTSGTPTNLQWKDIDIDDITVHVPKKWDPCSKKIRVQLVDEPFHFVDTKTHPLLTNRAGNRAKEYEGISAAIDPDSKSAAYILFSEISTPRIRYGCVWLNTNKGAFDPTVIIKKPPT